MARALRTCIISIPTTTEVVWSADWFYRATPCTGRRLVAAVQVVARCLPSAQMARTLGCCIAFRARPSALRTATELVRTADCSYRATPFMGRRLPAAMGAMARYSPSTLMGRDLRTCILSRLALVLILILPTATELFPKIMPD